MKNTLKYLMFAVALVFVLGINRVEALSVEEKWQQIANRLKESYSLEPYNIDSDDTTITINDSIRQCKFTLEDGIIVDDASINNEGYCDLYLSHIFLIMEDLFGYGENFYWWFKDHFQNLKLNTDGFEAIGELSSPRETDLECGFGSENWFDLAYCNENNKIVSQYFTVRQVKIDLNRGFVTYDPTYSSPTVSPSTKPKEEIKEEVAVEVPDTLSNNSTVILVVAGICILAGVGIIYYHSKPTHQG